MCAKFDGAYCWAEIVVSGLGHVQIQLKEFLYGTLVILQHTWKSCKDDFVAPEGTTVMQAPGFDKEEKCVK